MSTQYSFDFGVYLARFIGDITYTKNDIPQVCLDFLKQFLGIGWVE